MERDLSRVFFTKTFAVIYEFIFFNFLIKDRQTSVNLNFHVIKENLKRSKLKLWQHRTIWQEHSAKDFASYESYKRAGILYVFPPFITARMGQKIGRRPQTQLCGDALI